MKMLTIAIVLILIPFASHAERRDHFNHNKYEQGRNSSSFWQDVEHQQYKQKSRIQRGIQKGQLTHREARKLKREQRHLAKQIRSLKRRHYINRTDKRSVFEHLDYVSQKIRALKHNEYYARRPKYKSNKHSRHYNTRYNYGNNSQLSWANNSQTAGFYFRF